MKKFKNKVTRTVKKIDHVLNMVDKKEIHVITVKQILKFPVIHFEGYKIGTLSNKIPVVICCWSSCKNAESILLR